MNNKKIKQTIAREGLILIGVIALGCLIYFVYSIYPPYKAVKSKFDITTAKTVENTRDYYAEEIEGKSPPRDSLPKITPEQARAELERRENALLTIRADRIRDRIAVLGVILFYAYALYLIPIKFIIWAVRTLRER